MKLVKEFITSTKNLNIDDIVVVGDPDGSGLKASLPNVAIQPNHSSEETFEIVGFGVDKRAAVYDLTEKLQIAVNKSQLVRVEQDTTPVIPPPSSDIKLH